MEHAQNRAELLAKNIQAIAAVMAQLRSTNGGCPWDIAQTFSTIAPYTVEEAYEVADAIARNNLPDLKEELGDLLFQVVFHAQMASESGAFDFADVAGAITSKMVQRHPHVFGGSENRSASEQTLAWEHQKAAERAAKSSDTSALAGVALALPSLKRAQKLQARAARVGFDWPTLDGVMEKVGEEYAEVTQALAAGNADWVAEEIGDLLFSLVNLARKLDVDAETALSAASNKFERRFRDMEATTDAPLSGQSLDALEALWQQAKARQG